MTNPVSDFYKVDRERALAALKTAEAFIQSEFKRVDRDVMPLLEKTLAESARIQRANASLVMALLTDEDTPAELFKPWASVRRIRDWRDAKKLTVTIRHGRCCCKPSDFFAFWRTMPDETRSARSR